MNHLYFRAALLLLTPMATSSHSQDRPKGPLGKLAPFPPAAAPLKGPLAGIAPQEKPVASPQIVHFVEVYGETMDGMLLGGYDLVKKRFVNQEQASRSLRPSTTFQVFGRTESLGRAVSGKLHKSETGTDQNYVPLRGSSRREEDSIATTAPWNLLPRLARLQNSNQKVYNDVVNDFLKTRGLRQPRVRITQILRVDLEGDGEDEVLISATYPDPQSSRDMAAIGDYSVVLLRKVVNGSPRTILVSGIFFTRKGDLQSGLNSRDVFAVVDLDGDGKLEVVVREYVYEGIQFGVHKIRGTQVTKILEAGDGA